MKYLIIFSMSLVGVVGCKSEPTDVIAPSVQAVVLPEAAQVPEVPAAEKVTAEKSFHYSPFVVQVQGSKYFQSISFKDVGLQRPESDPNDPVLEAIAESLSLHLTEDGAGLMTRVAYDEAQLDPGNHTACGQNHIYVDVWRKGERGWGYSLWSGCGEESNFEWREIPDAPAGEIVDEVEPLTQAIAESLRAASKSECFTKAC